MTARKIIMTSSPNAVINHTMFSTSTEIKLCDEIVEPWS